MPNHLINENSPYLLQHANNPVDWYPWSQEALEKARTENKPIFLSIGYAACHWCHVMEHESFEDPETADLLNQHFVSIKVDREERPDLDGIYMNAVVAMTGQGGWPMSMFLTPEGEPFYGGTYFPPTRRYGMPAFKELLAAIANAWENEREELRETGQKLAQQLAQSEQWGKSAGGLLRQGTLEQAVRSLLSSYDWRQGGWGRAPRFPQPMAIEFLMMQSTRSDAQLKEETLQATTHVLRTMSRGGMYDVVGGGFHRYSVDDEWLVPHFEKMLYDNGQLALAYLHAFLLTGDLTFQQVCTDTLDFITREITDPAGGFYSSLDADSEGEEGKYYVWTPEEIAQALPDAAERKLLEKVYPVTKEGNFEGKNILQRQAEMNELAREFGLIERELIAQLSILHHKLNSVRGQRMRPGTDDKVLVSWNGLALRAFAEAARYLGRGDYLETARKNADFLLTEMYSGDQLLRSWRKGKAHHNAYLEDYAALILGLLALYQSDPNLRWYAAAVRLAEDMNANFRDTEIGFFDTHANHEKLLTRPKEIQDNATPSGNGLAAYALLQLSAYDERDDWRARSEGMLSAVQELLTRHPTAFGMWLQAFDFAIGPVQQIALIGPEKSAGVQEMREYIWHSYRPRTVVAFADGAPTAQAPALLHDRIMVKGLPTAYVCQGFTCNFPVNTLIDLKRQVG